MTYLKDFYGTKSNAVDPRPVAAAVADFALLSPQKIAVTCGHDQLSYRDLFRRARGVAKQLIQLDVGAEDVVLVQPTRSIDATVLVLGVLLSGAIVCPLDPEASTERRENIAKTSKARCLLLQSDQVDSEQLRRFADEKDLPILVEGERAESSTPLPVISADQGCYLLFTSGTTGTPKGVLMPHRGLANLVVWDQQFNGYTPSRVHLQFAAHHFDIAFHELFGALATGGTAVIATEQERRDPQLLLDRLIGSDITHAYLPYSVMNQLALASAGAKVPSTLTDVTTAGEPLKLNQAIRDFFAKTGANLHNNYGSTEVQDVTSQLLSGDPVNWPDLPSIGQPIAGMDVGVLTDDGFSVSIGARGQIVVRGPQVARGYMVGAPGEITPLPSANTGHTAEFLTSDMGHILPDGSLEITGRVDQIVKIRGKQVDLSTLETVIEKISNVEQAAAISLDQSGRKTLIVFLICADSTNEDDLRADVDANVTEQLGAHAIPSRIVVVEDFPKTSTGKVDRRALGQMLLSDPDPETAPKDQNLVGPDAVSRIWNEVLPDGLGLTFQDAGGDSLSAMQLASRLKQEFQIDFSVTNVSQKLTVDLLADLIGKRAAQQQPTQSTTSAKTANGAVAIIGLAGTFPDASSVDALWGGLLDSKVFLEESYNDPPEMRDDPNFVPLGGFVKDYDYFDAEFFGVSDREANFMDPQHRLFLQSAWKALESSGYQPDAVPHTTGVFSSCGASTYLINNILPTTMAGEDGPYLSHRLIRKVGDIITEQGTAPEHVAMRVSNKLNLTGPSMAVSTACSGGLVTVHQAVQAIRNGDAEMAIAGGVSVSSPQGVGYFAHDGVILSPSGACRPFDDKADGAIFGNGCAVLVLKDLDRAIADGDPIVATILGTAINNDGSRKHSYTGPSIEGQVEVIEAALQDAGLDACDIDYVEAHGTGTPVGDPIEMAALLQTYGAVDSERTCFVGSVKSNIGHLDEAAGAVSLLKTAKCLQTAQIPGIPNFTRANARLELEGTRIQIAAGQTQSWPGGSDRVRYAAVTSLGIGGTNCHIVLGSPPKQASDLQDEADTPQDAGHELFVLSAASNEQLEEMCGEFIEYLTAGAGADTSLRDICMTSCLGRRHERFRLAFAVDSKDTLVARLDDVLQGGIDVIDSSEEKNVVALFTGQGCQWNGMGQRLAQAFPVFAEAFDDCLDCIKADHDIDLRAVIGGPDDRDPRLNDTRFTQPAIFAFEYAMTRLLMSFGIKFEGVAGHSFGEVAALVASDVLGLRDACCLVVERGRLSGDLPAGQGAMAVVEGQPADIELFQKKLDPNVWVAAHNAPSVIVLSGDTTAISKLTDAEVIDGCTIRRLPISHAFHSPMMEPMVNAYQDMLRGLEFGPLKVPILSSVTGNDISDQTDWPAYFTDHLLGPVRFHDVLSKITQDTSAVFIELGAKPMLLGLGMTNDPQEGRPWIASCKTGADIETFLAALGQLFTAGVNVDFTRLSDRGDWRKASMPTYHFRNTRFTIDPPEKGSMGNGSTQETRRLVDRRRMNSRKFWFGEHIVDGVCILPGTFLLDVIAQCASAVLETTCVDLREFQICAKALADPTRGVELEIDTYAEEESGTHKIEVKRIDPETGERQLVAKSKAYSGELPLDAPPALEGNIRAVEAARVYARYQSQDVAFGPSFQTLSGVQVTQDAGVSHCLAPPILQSDRGYFGPHPLLVDTALQVIEAVFESDPINGTFVPIGIDRIVIRQGSTEALRCDAWNCERKDGESTFDFTLSDEGCGLLVAGTGFRQLEIENTSSMPKLRSATQHTTPVELVEATGKGVVVHMPNAALPDMFGNMTQVQVTPDLTNAQLGVALRDADFVVVPTEAMIMDMAEHVLEDSIGRMVTCFSALSDALDTAAELKLVVTGPASASGDLNVNAVSEALFGFARSFSLESGLSAPICVRLDATLPGDVGAALSQEVLRAPSETGSEVTLIAKGRSFIRYDEVAMGNSTDVSLKAEAAYVVTGGFGSLGPVIVETLIAAGAKNIHILGRSAPSPAQLNWIARLERSGNEVLVHQVDVSDRTELHNCLERIDQDREIRGVIHAAGVLCDGLVGSITPEETRKVLSAKPIGAMNLHHFFQKPDALDFFMLFSSTASTQGAIGQSLHSAACGMLKGLYQHRAHAGLPATCIHWGIWRESEFFLNNPNILARFAEQGDAGLTHEQGANLLKGALNHPVACLEAVNRSDPAASDIDSGTPPMTTSPIKLDVPPNPINSGDLAEVVQRQVARLIGLSDVSKVNMTASWRDLGVDSLLMIELRNVLRKDLGGDLPAGAIMRSVSVEDLIRILSPQDPQDSQTCDDAETDGPCLALIPGITGEPLDFANLMPHFADLPSQVIEYPSDMDPWSHPVAAPELLAEMTRRVQSFANGRPVILVGYSFGGKIASLVAHNLAQEDQAPYKLIVLDIPKAASQKYKVGLAAPDSLDLGVFTRLLAKSPDDAFAKLDAVCAAGRPDESLLPIASVYWSNVLISPELEAKPLDVPTTFVRAGQTGALGDLLPDDAQTLEDPTWGWDGVARAGLSLIVAEGDHFSMIRGRYADNLGKQIQTILAQDSVVA